MKKPVLLFCLFLTSIKALYCQTYDIKFPTGETKNFEFLYDDPNKMSKLNIAFYFFGFTVISDGALTFQLEPEYRINPKLYIHAKITTAYSKKMDGNIGYANPVPSYFKSTLDMPLMAHYSLFQKIKMKDKKIGIAYEGNTVYTAKLPRKMAHDLLIDAGIWYSRIPSNYSINANVKNDTSYFAPMFKTTSLAAGLSYYKHESFKFRTDNNFTSFQRYSRLYFCLTYALTGNYDVYGNYYQTTGANTTNTKFETTQGYIEPKLNRIAWRAGWEKHMGFKSSPLSLVIGLDLGSLPYLSQTPSPAPYTTQDKTDNFIFSVHFGLGFGGKIKN